jgi:hypothetical protein
LFKLLLCRRLTVLRDQLLDERSESRVDVILDNTDPLFGTLLDPSSHVHLQHGENLSSILFVALGDRLGSEKTSLFCGEVVELDRQSWSEVGVSQSLEAFEGRGSSRAIVIGSAGLSAPACIPGQVTYGAGRKGN